ncbi:NHL repeat-containing protein 3 [Holothuria leucospilota]|uniref:NHL repeat-containing protein 3 n=1 Tax=Holothuria leucospilota TaxID=206669 RepID=A0A9Q0YMQ6_HOLLE|nr:NHL repeat-containing protein 3 [Holothuria leucospilota]
MHEMSGKLSTSSYFFLLVHLGVHISKVFAETIEYRLDDSWPKDKSLFSAPIFSVAVNQDNGDVYVAKRNTKDSNILHFLRDGEFKRFLQVEGTLEQVHGLTFHTDLQGKQSLWATDVGNGSYGYTVKEYSLDGALLRMLGTPGIAGSHLKPLQFGNVADVAFDARGLLYAVDGDGGVNNRLIKLNSTFQDLWSVGKEGSGEYEFHIPHSVAVSPRTGNVWVADRMNNRLLVFDQKKPTLLASCSMKGGQPYSVRFSADGSHLIVAQLNNDTVTFVSSVIDSSVCKTLGFVQLTKTVKPHLVDVDLKSGAFYVGEIGIPGCQRFVPVQKRKVLGL